MKHELPRVIRRARGKRDAGKGIIVKCISLWQPWATLIAAGAKLYETRSWSTSYRGPLAIHAAKRWAEEQLSLIVQEPFRSELLADYYVSGRDLPFGAIIAVVNLIGCQPTSMYCHKPYSDMLTENEAEFGDWTPGRYAWQLVDIRKLPEPIPYRGKQGLWELEPEIVEKIICEAQAAPRHPAGAGQN